jgi:hypothetical protein
MACYIEEECDWSDGSLEPQTSCVDTQDMFNAIVGCPLQSQCDNLQDPLNATVGDSLPTRFVELQETLNDDDTKGLFIADETADKHTLPASEPTPFGQHGSSVPTRAQRAQLGIHLNRREPSKDDYTNFALYQANQKVYEATLLKTFLAQALHPDRLAQWFEDDADHRENLTMYLRSVLQNVNGMTNKMIYNAHSRTVNLLANDGRDGVPFLDVHGINKRMFSDFCPDNAVSVVSRMNGSWHRATQELAMVRMSTKQYPVGASSSPIEEIDEVADKLANASTLPTGRAKPTKKQKGKLPSLPRRDETGGSRGNWLAFLSSQNHCEAIQAPPSQSDAGHVQNHCESIQAPLLQIEAGHGQAHCEAIQATPTQTAAGHEDRVDSPVGGGWRMRLVQAHKRMLAIRYPPKKQQRVVAPRKRQKTSSTSSSSSPSGSTTLELHQILPPDAYFEPREPDEKPAWRCGIKHAMGHYYNAGNRKSCPGCFVNIKESSKTKHMDFYLPPSSHFFQPAPDVVYKPSKLSSKARRSKQLSHNSIAKEAYWAAIHAGASAEEARQAGVDAVEAFLLSRVPKEPTPEPTPEPEPDLGPHPSGSTTMEHGQDLPECAYAEKTERHEEPAWRCDLNHALGRYYLAGDKRSCPGCGSNRTSESKKATMDFYMPFGVVVRQEAPGLSHWKPRKKNKMTRSSASKTVKQEYLTHNQIASRKYFEAVSEGLEHDDAVRRAIEQLEEELEAKQAASLDVEMKDTEKPDEPRCSLKRPFEEEEEAEDNQEYVSPVEVVEVVGGGGTSSSDEDTSGSDSE